MGLKCPKFGIAFSPSAEALISDFALHWLFACHAAFCVELAMAASATESRSLVFDWLAEFGAATGVAAVVPQALIFGHAAKL